MPGCSKVTGGKFGLAQRWPRGRDDECDHGHATRSMYLTVAIAAKPFQHKAILLHESSPYEQNMSTEICPSRCVSRSYSGFQSG